MVKDGGVTLRKANGIEVVKRGVWFLAEYDVVSARGTVAKLDAGEHRQAQTAIEDVGVAEVAREHDRVLWWAADGFYWGDAGMTAEEVALLLWDRQRRNESRLERLRKIRAREEQVAELTSSAHPGGGARRGVGARRGALRALRRRGRPAVRPRDPGGEGRRERPRQRAGAVRGL